MSHTATADRRPNRRITKIATLAVAPLALLVSGLIVGQASYSAYSATTVNPASNWSSGTVALRDDDSNAAAFNASNLAPGATGTKCIAVTSTGSLPATVKMYGTSPTTTKALSSYINLTITQGSGGSFGSCDGFTPLSSGADVYSGTLESFGASHRDYATGAGSWATTGGTAAETRVYKISYVFSAAAPNTTMGGTAAISFTWEAQSGSTPPVQVMPPPN